MRRNSAAKGTNLALLKHWALVTVVLGAVGGLAAIGDAVCKKRWSVSFAFLTSSFSGLWLCICFYIVDILDKRVIREQLVKPFLWLGMNPLFIYISMTMLNTLVDHNIHFPYKDDPRCSL